jgi:hypothetical protein
MGLDDVFKYELRSEHKDNLIDMLLMNDLIAFKAGYNVNIADTRLLSLVNVQMKN